MVSARPDRLSADPHRRFVMKSIRIFAIAFASLVLGAVSTGSLSGCGETDEAFDCAQVCSAYDDCVDGDTDQTECVSACEDWADENQDNADRLDDCENCLDGNSCVESAFQCLDECAFIPTSE